MSFESFKSDAKSSFLGNSKKAVLIIYDKKNAKPIVDEFSELTYASLIKNSGIICVKKTLEEKAHILQVQYNPSSITIQANSEEVAFQSLQKNIDNDLAIQNTRPPSLVLSVDLIFDQVNNKDAFMFEKFHNNSAGDLISKNAYKNKLDGYTVQPQTNGLIGMVMRTHTNTVTFQWADMRFTGEVSEMNSRYTMFSVSGKPIRSIVKLNITQTVDNGGEASYWNKAFDKCFGSEDIAQDSGGKNKMESLGNLINIQF